jgi:ribonuclease P protein component
MRFTRQASLNRAQQFARVRASGVSTAGRFLVLSALALEDPTAPSKFGVICTKKVGHAVMRNTLKRRVRELVRAHADAYASGYYMVIILRWRAAEASYQELEKDWLKTEKRLNKELAKQKAASTVTQS